MTTTENKIEPAVVNVEAEITKAVFAKMGGKPKNYRSMRACNVFDNAWRVTVYLEVKADTLVGYKIEPTSFFFRVSPEGGVTLQRS